MSKNNKIKTGAKAGAYSAVLTLIVIAAAIVVNLIVNALPAKYTKFDTTANSVFTFDEKTEKFISELSEDITVYHIVESGYEDMYLTEILNRYKDMNSHITVQTVDPVKNPTFVEKYTEEALASNSLIIESAERSKLVPYSEIYYIYCPDLDTTMDYSTFEYYYQMYYQYYGTALSYSEVFAGENAVVSGIDYVTTDALPVVYILSGHGEATLNTAIRGWLDTQNYQTQTLTLSEQDVTIDGTVSSKVNAVPEDASLVLINAPTTDITDAELASLTSYVAGGGDLIVLSNYATADLENVRALAAAYGMDISTGVVIETDTAYYSSYQYNIKAHLGSHAITSSLSTVMMPTAHGITIAETMPEGMTATELLYTGDTAFAKPLGFDSSSSKLTTKEEGDIGGPFSLGVLVECENAGSVAWYSSDVYMVNSGSQDVASLYTNTVSYLCDKVETISVHTIELSASYLEVTDSSANMWGVLVIGIIPLAFIGCGFYVWLRRRSK